MLDKSWIPALGLKCSRITLICLVDPFLHFGLRIDTYFCVSMQEVFVLACRRCGRGDVGRAWNAWQNFQIFQNVGTTTLFGNVREHFVNYAHPMRYLIVPVRWHACSRLVIPPSHTRIFLTSPYGSPTRSQSQASVNNSLVSVNNSSQLATTRRHS